MDNSALVPTDGSQSQFTQQGSLDWISLAQTTISFPMSVLARLAAADIAPHTVVVGQRISSSFVLSARGTERLTDALNRLPSCSSIGNVIWFGFGIRHIVREIAQTAPGMTLLALCGALAELHTPMACASILMKLAEVCGAPAEQRPSSQQWINMVEACSGILRPTTFGCIVGQFMAFCPRQHHRAGEPESVARALHALALLSSNELDSITLVGDAPCGWIAAFGYFFLGLDVEIKTADGILCYRSAADEGHVRVFIIYDKAGRSNINWLQVSRKAYRIKTIDGIFSHGNRFDFAMSGSVPWEKCITEAFGTRAVRLLGEARVEFGNLIGCAARVFQGLAQAEPSRYFQRRDFQTWFGFQTGQSGLGFVESAISWFPELAVLRDHIHPGQRGSVDDALGAYTKTASRLSRLCRCNDCYRSSLKFSGQGPYCFVLLAETIVVLAWTLSGMKLDADLKPYRAGLRFLYQLHDEGCGPEYGTGYRSQARLFTDTPRIMALTRHLGPASVYHTAQFLFTTSLHAQTTCTAFTAAAVGGICFHFGLLREVSDAPERAAILHIMPGSIATPEGRRYAHVIDKTKPNPYGTLALDWRERKNMEHFSTTPGFDLSYFGQPPSMCHSVGPELSEETGSNDLEASLVVEETPQALLVDLYFSGSRGFCRVGVYNMLMRVIGSSGRVHCSQRGCAALEELPDNIWIVDGEGRMPPLEQSSQHRAVYIRRLTGNPLARCVGLLVGPAQSTADTILRRRECIPCCVRAALSGGNGPAFLIL